MAENARLIIKQEEIFKPQWGKIKNILIDNPLAPQMVGTDPYNKLNDIPTEYSRKVASIYKDSDSDSNSISYFNNNNKDNYVIIQSLRTRDISYVDIIKTGESLMEKIPIHPHIRETLKLFELIEKEYPRKRKMLVNFRNNMFDPGYAEGMYMVGKGQQINVVSKVRDTQTKILDMSFDISGYIKVENAPSTIKLFYILRGIPLPMRKTLTSYNLTTNNYIFTYPQYLMDNIDLIQSIQYIEVQNYTGATFWYGNNYRFNLTENGLEGYGDKLSNLHIINKDKRNLRER